MRPAASATLRAALALLLLAAAGACAAPATDPAPAPLAAAGKGDRYAAAGKTVGGNAFNLLFMDPGPADAVIANARARLGARYLRVFGIQGGCQDPVAVATGRKDQICGYHAAHGIQFVVAFVDKGVGEPAFPSNLDVFRKWQDGSYGDTCHYQFARSLVQQVEAACPGAILAWEIGNEIHCSECADAGPAGAERQSRYGAYQAFLTGMPRALAAFTSKPVLLGLIRATWADFWREGGVAMASTSNLAMNWRAIYGGVRFVTLHPYGWPDSPNGNARYDDPAWHDYDLGFGKSVMFEELGASPHSTDERDRCEAFKYWIDAALANRSVTHLAPWNVTDEGHEPAGMTGLGGCRAEIEAGLLAVSQGRLPAWLGQREVPPAAPAPAEQPVGGSSEPAAGAATCALQDQLFEGGDTSRPLRCDATCDGHALGAVTGCLDRAGQSVQYKCVCNRGFPGGILEWRYFPCGAAASVSCPNER